VRKLAKTDALDAQVIAHFAEAVRPEPRPIPDEDARRLGELVARRHQVIETMVAERLRRRGLTQKRLIRAVDAVLDLLQKQFSDIEAQIDDDIRGKPAWREKDDLLKSVPGIGNAIARTLIAQLPELGSDRRKIAALAGVAPFARDSGKLRGKRRIAGGRAPVRSALFMATLVSIRRNLPLAATCNRLLQAGKPKMVAITACMRKLLTILDAIIRERHQWQNP
jgi:transposase